MAAFPALEVMTNGAHGLPVGSLLRLTGKRMVLGAGQAELVFEHHRWWLRNLKPTDRVIHLGESVHDAELLHGDCFEVGAEGCFRLLLHQPVEVRHAAMERGLIEQPDDAERWAVYADWLMEHGVPLGERLIHAAAVDDRRWLGPLAKDAARGDLEVVWAHGVPSRVVLRRLSAWHSEVGWEERLATLLRQPQFRFVRELQVDVGSFRRESAHSSWGARLLDQLGPDGLPLLERVSIGPGTVPADVKSLEGVLAARSKRFPHFKTGAQTLFVGWRKATLRLSGRGRERLVPIERPTVLRVSPARERVVRRPRSARDRSGQVTDLDLGPQCPPFSISFGDDRWQLELSAPKAGRLREPVRVNTIASVHALLRPGDVIEPVSGVRLQFEA